MSKKHERISSKRQERIPGKLHAGHIGDGEYRRQVLFDENSGQVVEVIAVPGDAAVALELARRWNASGPGGVVAELMAMHKRIAAIALTWLNPDGSWNQPTAAEKRAILEAARAALEKASVQP